MFGHFMHHESFVNSHFGQGSPDARFDGGERRPFGARGFGGHGRGFTGGERGPFGARSVGRDGRGFGGGARERMFESGELQLVILHLLAEEPSYGYQLIKTMEERLSGGYTPSPGVVYPTLTLLEEEGFTTGTTSESGKKIYTVTEEGKKHLEANRRRIEQVLGRLEQAGRGFERGRSPVLMRSFMNLRGAVEARVQREGLTPEHLKKVVEAINTAARTIDEL